MNVENEGRKHFFFFLMENAFIFKDIIIKKCLFPSFIHLLDTRDVFTCEHVLILGVSLTAFFDGNIWGS